VLENAEGMNTTPSIVAFTADGEKLVGLPAKRQAVTNPLNTFFAIKRLIGRRYDDPMVEKDKNLVPYKIVKGPNGDAWVEAHGKTYSPQQISAYILQKMKETAEAKLGETITQAVITVPAYFNDGQRQATKDAGMIAGLDVLRILNEPTAAALCFGYGKSLQQKVVIYDLGGGTFDVSVLEIGKDVFEVVSTAGDTYLGGDDFDDRLIDYFADTFFQQSKIDLRKDKGALQRLKSEAERVKIALSQNLEETASVPAIAVDKSGQPKDLSIPISRNLFANITYDLIQRTFKVCDEALQAAHLTVSDLDGVILVGGSTKMPIIQDAVRNYYLKEPKIGVDPDLVVAMGAAIQADSLSASSTSKSLLLDVTPQSLGIGTAGGLCDVIIARNSSIPTSAARIFTTSRDNQTSVKISVFQGESRNSAENEPLGEFTLSGLKPGPRGDVKIEVNFDIDSDGLVSVMARDQLSGKEERIKITVSGGLSSDELQKAREEAMQVEV
jgi:molecular chaperone DnaK